MILGSVSVISLFVIISLVSALEEDNLIVQLPEGKIRGHIRKSFDGNEYYSFQQIPYALPPLGVNRFKEPQGPESWDGILNTTRNTKQCIQMMDITINPILTETEDCLYINVYSPKEPGSDANLPVMVYIHGGAFMMGSSDILTYNPGRFVDYNIIVVTFNYRVGPFGFLTTGDGVIPANVGLKDQLFAMKWVNSNIHLFGGDPKKVTIAGESAGACSVGFQLLGKNTSGLFRAAIQQSGSSVSQMCYSPSPRINAFNLGTALSENFTSEESADLLNLLIKASPEHIVEASHKITPADAKSAGYVPRLKWLPVIENESEENPLVTTPMHESFMNGDFHQVPVLLGFDSEEALFFMDEAYDYLAEDYDKYPNLLVDSEFNIDEHNATIVGNELKKIYTNSSFTKDKAAFIKYSSDAGFISGMLRQAEVTAPYAPAYVYRFSYVGVLGSLVNENQLLVPGAEGVGHSEDLMYIWDVIPPFVPADVMAMKRLLIVWTNFIKYLEPTPYDDEMLNNIVWPKVDNSSSVNFVNIDTKMEVQSDPRYYSKVRDLLLEYMQPPYTVI